MPALARPTDLTAGHVLPVHQGECHVSDRPSETFSTILGSCVSACVRDRVTGVGGMNHFLLAARSGGIGAGEGASARYGAFAMEQLINMVLASGSGIKANLEFKVFGGGTIHSGLADVGAANIAFVRGFLADEGFSIASSDLGGPYARKVLFQPTSGRAFVKRLEGTETSRLARDELALATRRPPQPRADAIELF